MADLSPRDPEAAHVDVTVAQPSEGLGMSKLLRALVKAGAVRVEDDGTLTPTHNRTAREAAAVFSDQQLLLADGEGITIFSSTSLRGSLADTSRGVCPFRRDVSAPRKATP